MRVKQWVILAIFAVALVIILTTDVGSEIVDAVHAALRSLTNTEQAHLDSLLPQVEAAVEAFRQDWADQGYDVLLGSAARTPSQQEQILEKGTTSTATHSWHLLGRAIDCYPIDPATGRADMDGKNDALFRAMHATAAKYGFTNLAYNADGSRRTLINAKGVPYWDGGHMQFTEGMTFAQAQAHDAEEASA